MYLEILICQSNITCHQLGLDKIKQEQKPVYSLEPIKDPREIVQMRGQRVHHTEVLHSPWYGQHQSPTVPGFLEVTKDVKLNWNLENKVLATLINSSILLYPLRFLQLVGWWWMGQSCRVWLTLDQLANQSAGETRADCQSVHLSVSTHHQKNSKRSKSSKQ